LFLGTHQDNMDDMASKGRRRSTPHLGEAHAMAKLNEGQVREIRRRYAAGDVTQTALALVYGVTKGTIRCIVIGRNWTHVV
jgi:DNA-binding transcriptional regulator YiaG